MKNSEICLHHMSKNVLGNFEQIFLELSYLAFLNTFFSVQF